MTPPSKELLSAVFGKKVGKIETKGVYLEYEHWENCINHQKQDISGYDITRINIYELAFRVKEWAYSQEEPYELISGCLYAPFSDKQYICEITNEDITLYADTEPEAIFKAAEWILNQQDKGEV